MIGTTRSLWLAMARPINLRTSMSISSQARISIITCASKQRACALPSVFFLNHDSFRSRHILSSASRRSVTIKHATSSSSSSSSSTSQPYASYDWTRQWYAVSWVTDIPLNTPYKTTLFDVDYVVVRTPSDVYATRDACPHRLASLAEGRVTTDGRLQCAYHGWSIEGDTGDIHVPQAPRGKVPCATMYPCMVKGGLVWLLPCEGADAVTAPPPYVPEELDHDDVAAGVVRDVPIDFSLLLENVVDYDHGLFAHQVSGFDLYCGSLDHPQEVSTSYDADGRFEVTMTTKALPKVLETNSLSDTASPLTATAIFKSPQFVSACRFDDEGKTSFKTVFWLVPTGVGRSRFLSKGYAPGKKKGLPRWVQHLFINRFLDQDSHLLVTEQSYVLAEEFKAAAEKKPLKRDRVYRYASPGEKLLAAIGKWLDTTVPKQPGRYDALKSVAALARIAPAFTTAPREITLDRWSQHTAVCADSQAMLRNARWLACIAAAAAACLAYRGVQVLASQGGWYCVAHCAFSAVCLLVSAVSAWIVTEFSGFRKTALSRDADLRRIPTLFPDQPGVSHSATP